MRAVGRIFGVVALLLVSCLLLGFTLADEAEEKEEFVEGLKQDIIKVDQSIQVTKDLMNRSTGAPFLPDIVFRLAELYVEKSRMSYYLEVETKGVEQAVGCPECKLLKNEAINIYRDIMARFPEFRDNDKVLFALGHEYLELGMLEDMLRCYKKLIDDYPKSALLLDSLLKIAELYFNQDNLIEAEKYYLKILDYRESPTHDMARYKLAWIAINHAKEDKSHWKKGLKLFEQVATSANLPGEGDNADGSKLNNLRIEAIEGIVFCYTEVFPAQKALEYFMNLSPSKNVYLHALSKLANRYFIKEQFDNAAMLYRRIIELSNDTEKNLDYAQRIYDASAYSKNKDKVDEDVRALVKAAARYVYSWRIPDQEKAQLEKEFEIFARDIVTKLHLLAQKRQEKNAYRTAARAYKNYLSFFEFPDKAVEMKFNYAESLYNCNQYVEAGRIYEDIAKESENKSRKDAMYSAIQSYQRALGDPKFLTRFGAVEAREAIKQLGGYYVQAYPDDPKTPTIKFNVGRMYFEQGDYKQAMESFLDYIQRFPSHSEVRVAGHLALDCYKLMEDYQGLSKQGKALLANAAIKDEEFKKEVLARVNAAENRALDKKTLTIAGQGKNAAEALLDYAGEVDASQAENVIYRSFIMAKEKRDIQLAFKAGGQLAKQYPQSKNLFDIYATLGNFSAQSGEFGKAATLYEDFFQKFPNKQEAKEAMFAAAKFRSYLGEYREAIRDYQALLSHEASAKRSEMLLEIADAYVKLEDWKMVMTSANQANSETPSAKSQLLMARSMEKQGKKEDAKQSYMAAAGMGGNSSSAAEAQFRASELVIEEFKLIRFGQGGDDKTVLEQKMQVQGALDQLLGGVVQMKDAEWAIASLYRLSQVYLEMAAFLESAPVPAGLNAQQQAQYRQVISQKASEQKETAQTYLSTCTKTVRDKKIFGSFALACAAGGNPSVDLPPKRRSGTPPDEKSLETMRQKLLRNPNDVAALDELAMMYIWGGDHLMARLLLSKALEINENHAPSLNLLGVVALHLGDEQEAFDDFSKALDADTGFPQARLNLAALFTKYKDQARAQAVMKSVASQMKRVDLSKPDIHPLVKETLTELRAR